MIRDIIASNLNFILPVSGESGVFLREAADPGTWNRLRNHPEGQRRLALLSTTAEKLLAEQERVIGFNDFMRFYRDGSREEYQLAYFARRRRLEVFAIAVLSGGGREYLRALEDTLWAICDEYSWCLPAHMPLVPGPERREHRREVDLFAAETAFACAEILNLLGQEIAPEVRMRMRHEILGRVVDSFIDFPHGFFWETATNNWSAVCAGSVGAAALYLTEDADRLRSVISRLARPLDAYISGFAADGACAEGMGYWTYGFGFYVCFADLLERRSGGRIDLIGDPAIADKIRAIALFPQRSRMTGDALASFSDSTAPFRYPLGITCALSRRIPEVGLPPFAYAEQLDYDLARRWCKHVRDYAWFDPDLPALEENDSASHFFPDAQWLVVRAAPKVPGAPVRAFAAKAGRNDEPHNHNDIGSFILAAGTDILMDDFGAGSYDRGYFGPERYSYFVNSSRSHSVPVIDGTFQEDGANRAARDAEYADTPHGGKFSFDMSAAYPQETGNGLRALERQFVFDGPETDLILTDTFRLCPDSSSGAATTQIRERFATLLDATTAGPDTVTISGKESKATIRALRVPDRIEIAEERFLDHGGNERLARLVDFVYTAAPGTSTLAFRFGIEPRKT